MKTVQTRATTRSRKLISENDCEAPVNVPNKLNKKNVKNRPIRTRKALEDRTNSKSGSDSNLSGSPSKLSSNRQISKCVPPSRPKRIRQVPSRFKDYGVSPISSTKGKVDSFTSTPLSSSHPEKRNSQIACKLSPIKEPVLENSPKKPKFFRNRLTEMKSIKPIGKSTNVTSNDSKSHNTITKTAFKHQTRINLNLNSKTKKKISEKVLIFEKNTTHSESSISMQSIKSPTPIYKKNIIGDNLRVDDKSALYEFEYDPTCEPITTKKKKMCRNNPIKRKKKMSRKSTDLAMQKLIEDIKKIQEEKMMKKLVAKIKMKKQSIVENNQISQILTPNENTSKNNIGSVMQTELPSRNSVENRSPSPLNDMNINDSDVWNPPNTSFMNNEPIRFSNNPLANSSAIINEKPNCSPWRMDINSDVKKWRYNFYVKPSMTPAYERDTFHVIGLDDESNKNNYCDSNLNNSNSSNVAIMPSIYDNCEKPNQVSAKMLQTSILSFYANAIRKSPQKKNSSTKIKAQKNNVKEYHLNFDFSNENDNEVENEYMPKDSEEISEHISNDNIEPAIDNCFGFDDNSEEIDQENVSPITQKISPEKRIQRIKRINGNVTTVLQEINIRKKQISIETKQKNDFPIVEKETPEKISTLEKSSPSSQNCDGSMEIMTEIATSGENSEKQCPLFEDPLDVEVVHYNKPTRRSYVRKRKLPVRFQDPVINVTEHEDLNEAESFESVKYIVSAKTVKKRKFKKNSQLSKKEKKEAAEWAAGFNSMLEEVEEFPLCVE